VLSIVYDQLPHEAGAGGTVDELKFPVGVCGNTKKMSCTITMPDWNNRNRESGRKAAPPVLPCLCPVIGNFFNLSQWKSASSTAFSRARSAENK